MIVNGKDFKNLSITDLELYIEEMQDEIEKRKKKSCEREHEILYKTIISFKNLGYKTYLSDGGNVFINITDIKEIYNADFNCLFTFNTDCNSVEE